MLSTPRNGLDEEYKELTFKIPLKASGFKSKVNNKSVIENFTLNKTNTNTLTLNT